MYQHLLHFLKLLLLHNFINLIQLAHLLLKISVLDNNQQTFVLMNTSSRRLDQDEYIHITYMSSEEVFKTSSWRLDQYQYILLGHTSSGRLQDVFKMSCKIVFKTSSRCLQVVSNTSSRRLAKTFSRRLQNVFKTSCKHVFKTSSRCLAKMFSRPF